ncbi:MAG: class I SAM-dependent methyltransferase [Pseudobdellovibrionaceae bacterium]|nr:class I SAM-dependent methyltransferase [Pseudobdellovibrionaceae bacterium]
MMKLCSPGAERNKLPIFEVLNPILPANARVLEVASGSGQHAAFLCSQRPDVLWQPTDIDQDAFDSIRAFQLDCPTTMKEPIKWSVTDARPPSLQGPYDVVVNINMIHIAPWAACLSLLRQASQALVPEGKLFLYGPFVLKDRETAPSNQEFDRSLRERNPLWGLRDLDDVVAEAKARGLIFQRRVDMPANNISVIFEKVMQPT